MGGIYVSETFLVLFLQMISSCSDEDLIDIVLPRIAKVFTLWDFLLLKVQKGLPRRPQADHIYREFQTLAKEVKEVCGTFMQPATEKSTNTLKVGHWQLTVFYSIVFFAPSLKILFYINVFVMNVARCKVQCVLFGPSQYNILSFESLM